MRSTRDSRRPRQEVRTPADVRRLLATEIESLAANPDLDPIGRARILAQLMRVALRAMELETLDDRVQAIESALKLRTEAERVAASEPAWQPRKGAHAEGAK